LELAEFFFLSFNNLCLVINNLYFLFRILILEGFGNDLNIFSIS
jgi:hypothetical protein